MNAGYDKVKSTMKEAGSKIIRDEKESDLTAKDIQFWNDVIEETEKNMKYDAKAKTDVSYQSHVLYTMLQTCFKCAFGRRWER